jgi:phage portal protein BeeE
MEFHETKQAAAREIAIAFGVPPMLMGIPGDATYANYQEANRAFYRLTVLPLAQRVLAALSHWLAQFTGETVELRPDLDQIPALAVERDQQWARVGAADFLTRPRSGRSWGCRASRRRNDHAQAGRRDRAFSLTVSTPPRRGSRRTSG